MVLGPGLLGLRDITIEAHFGQHTVSTIVLLHSMPLSLLSVVPLRGTPHMATSIPPPSRHEWLQRRPPTRRTPAPVWLAARLSTCLQCSATCLQHGATCLEARARWLAGLRGGGCSSLVFKQLVSTPLWVFPLAWVWIMGYYRVMGYGVDFHTYQLRNMEFPWVIPVYGLWGAWCKRVLTVHRLHTHRLYLLLSKVNKKTPHNRKFIIYQSQCLYKHNPIASGKYPQKE